MNSKTLLLSKWPTHTSNGCISKGVYLNKNEDEVLVKGNIMGWYQPIAEVVSYKIAKLCGVETVEYELEEASKYPNIKVNNFKYVSVCKILPYTIFSLYNYCNSQKDFKVLSSKDYLNLYIERVDDYKCNDLFKMLFVDALVGNIDRHLNNINVFINDKNKLKLATPFDFGESILVGNLNPNIKEDVKSKPFKDYHKNQLKYISEMCKPDKIILPFKNSSIFKEEIKKEISDTLNLLEDDNRKNLILEFLNFRVDNIINEYVKYEENELNWS